MQRHPQAAAVVNGLSAAALPARALPRRLGRLRLRTATPHPRGAQGRWEALRRLCTESRSGCIRHHLASCLGGHKTLGTCPFAPQTCTRCCSARIWNMGRYVVVCLVAARAVIDAPDALSAVGRCGAYCALSFLSGGKWRCLARRSGSRCLVKWAPRTPVARRKWRAVAQAPVLKRVMPAMRVWTRGRQEWVAPAAWMTRPHAAMASTSCHQLLRARCHASSVAVRTLWHNQRVLTVAYAISRAVLVVCGLCAVCVYRLGCGARCQYSCAAGSVRRQNLGRRCTRPTCWRCHGSHHACL